MRSTTALNRMIQSAIAAVRDGADTCTYTLDDGVTLTVSGPGIEATDPAGYFTALKARMAIEPAEAELQALQAKLTQP